MFQSRCPFLFNSSAFLLSFLCIVWISFYPGTSSLEPFALFYDLIASYYTKGNRVPGSRVSGSHVPGSQFQSPKIPGPRVSGLRVLGLGTQGPGSWVSVLDFRLCWKKSLVNFKIHDVTIWLTNNYNTNNAQYPTN